MFVKPLGFYCFLGAMVLWCCMATESVAGGTNRSKAEQLNRLHREAFAKGEDAKALAAIDEAIQLDPTWDALFYNRASLYFRKGEMDRAIGDCDTALKLAKNPLPRFYTLRAGAYGFKGEVDKAIADARRATELDPNDYQLRVHLGRAYLDARQWERAIDEYSKVLKRNPDDYYSLVQRGAARCQIQDFDGGMADIEKAIGLDPKTMDAYMERAGALIDRGEGERALKDCDRLLQSIPRDFREGRNYRDVYRMRASIRRSKGDPDAAISDLSEALRLDPKCSAALLDRGQILGEKSEFANALADFTEFIRLCPRDPRGYGSRALAHFSLGDLESASADQSMAQKLSRSK